MDMGLSCRKNAFFQAPIKLAQPLNFPAPELRAKIFTDTRIFLILGCFPCFFFLFFALNNLSAP